MSAPGWEVVIGMEVHTQLSTRSKMFCGCSTDYLGHPPNSHVCEVCLGMPGVLPVINRAAVKKCVQAGLALGSEVARWTKFDRKNYFYPDLPKGYQISQYDLPLCSGGQIEVNGKVIGITRVHLEEDTGKSMHAGDALHSADRSFVDLNRAGIPLMEIVSEPDLRSADEARDYAMALRALLRAIGASDADMEKGQLRAEANVSVRREGAAEFGVKTELKNINSFRALKLAIEYEVRRQVEVLESGGQVSQETRGWDEAGARTYSQRSKEFAEDYRYFPEPDLPPLELDPAWIEGLRARLPELPAALVRRFMDQFGLSAYDAGLLGQDAATARYFEELLALGVAAKPAANWVIGEVLPRTSEAGGDGEDSVQPPAAPALARVVALVEGGAISRDQGRQVLTRAWAEGAEPDQLVEEMGFSQVADESVLEGWVDQAIAALPQAAADYRAGKQQAFGALMAEVKRISDGRASMKVAQELLRRKLG